MIKKVSIIINPAAGQDYPILSLLHKRLDPKKLSWDIQVTTKKNDTQMFITQAIKKKADAIAVYGGDGTIQEAVQVLYKQNVPLIVLPGGTANILAKELKIPIEIEKAVDLFTSKKYKIKTIDLGIVNNIPFLLRVSTGLLATMIVDTKKNDKESVGQLAYGLTMIKQLQKSPFSTYKINVDGKKTTEQGISIIIANSVNVGITGISLLPNINMTDGKLHVFVIRQSDLAYLSTVVKELIMDKKAHTLLHFYGKKVRIKMDPIQTVIADDTQLKTDTLSMSIALKALKIMVPASA